MGTALTKRQQFWLEHLRACEGSGETLRAYAQRVGVRVDSLYAAKGRLKSLRELQPVAHEERSRFVRLDVHSVERTVVASNVCRVRLRNGVMVEIPFTAADLKSVLSSAASL